MLSLVVAMGKNRAIGKDNQLLWHLPADLKNFKKLTMGAVMIMGRKTFESIGRPLPGRTTIIVTRDTDYKVEGAQITNSFDKALALASELSSDREVFIVGGGEIYRLALPKCDRIYLSEVDLAPAADTFFPEFEGFNLVSTETHEAQGDYPQWSYQIWERA